MAELTVEQMERFADLVSSGVDPASAYIKCGYDGPCGSRVAIEAGKLLDDDVIAQRIHDIKAGRPAPTRGWVLESLREVFHNSVAQGKFASANRALQLIGMDLGMFKHAEDGRRKRLEDMSAEELQSFAHEIESEIVSVAPPEGDGSRHTLQ